MEGTYRATFRDKNLETEIVSCLNKDGNNFSSLNRDGNCNSINHFMDFHFTKGNCDKENNYFERLTIQMHLIITKNQFINFYDPIAIINLTKRKIRKINLLIFPNFFCNQCIKTEKLKEIEGRSRKWTLKEEYFIFLLS